MNKLRLSFYAAALAACFALAPLQGEPQSSPQNERLLAALEPLEGLTETALGGNAGKIEKALKSAGADRAATRALLPHAAAAQFDARFEEALSAQQKHDHLAVSLAAAELYKLVASALDPATLTIPREVSLLDYVGFRTKALLAAAQPDWPAIAATAHEANGYWGKIRDRVTDAKLRSAMEQAQQDLASAAD